MFFSNCCTHCDSNSAFYIPWPCWVEVDNAFLYIFFSELKKENLNDPSLLCLTWGKINLSYFLFISCKMIFIFIGLLICLTFQPFFSCLACLELLLRAAWSLASVHPLSTKSLTPWQPRWFRLALLPLQRDTRNIRQGCVFESFRQFILLTTGLRLLTSPCH